MANFIDNTLSSLPYVRSMFGNSDIQDINKKFKLFEDANVTKEKKVQRLSIVNNYDNYNEYSQNAGKVSNMFYHQLIYNSQSDDKKRRLDEYRSMAQYPKVASAIREICNEFFERDDQAEIIKCALRGDNNEEVKNLIEKEFQKFIAVFKFEEKGWKLIRDFITEGEIFFENIVSAQKPELGILGVTRIAAERIDPLYYDIDNELIDSYILREKKPDMYPFQIGKMTGQGSFGSNPNKQQILFLNDKQVTYFYTDIWEPAKRTYRLPILSEARSPYRQLSMIEDATIIYMLVRAPERLVFNIDVGNMPAAKSEQYMKRMMAQWWSKKTIAQDGRVENVYDPQGMVENYWFAQPANSKGSSVNSVGGGKQSADNLDTLNYFVQNLYKSLNIPLSRLNSETVFSDGANITREELTFAEYIIQIQKMWAATLKNAFIVHLKLRGKKTTELVDKLKIEELSVTSKDKKSVDMLKITDVYQDMFTFKSWDLYDVLTETIDNRIKQEKKRIRAQIELWDNQIEILEQDLIQLQEQIITESDETLKEASANRYDSIVEEINSLIDSKDNAEQESENYEEASRSWWEQYDLREEDIDVKFNEPSQTFALREQQMLQLKLDNYNNMSQNDLISNTLAQKIYLGWKDHQILACQQFLRLDAAFRWELSQIEANGPDFREKALAELKGMEGGQDLDGLGGGGMGGGASLPSNTPTGTNDASLPEFGTPPETGGESETGAAPAGGTDTPPPAPKMESLERKRYKKLLAQQSGFDSRLLSEGYLQNLSLFKR